MVIDGTTVTTRQLLVALCSTPIGENFQFTMPNGEGHDRVQAIRMQLTRLRAKVKRIKSPKFQIPPFKIKTISITSYSDTKDLITLMRYKAGTTIQASADVEEIFAAIERSSSHRGRAS